MCRSFRDSQGCDRVPPRVANKERLESLVIAPANLNYYAVFDAVRTGPNNIANIPRRAFRFTALHANPGDHVILFTGPGANVSQGRPDGRQNHFFFWNLGQTIWEQPASCAVLIEITSWETSF
jgi:hypothetical protein